MADSVPLFKSIPVEIKSKSEKEGRAIFEDKEVVEIRIPGDMKTVVTHKVSQKHIDRWPEHYKAFKEGMEAPLVGYPLTEYATLTASKVAELKYLNIRTVEELAGLNDSFISRLGMGGREMVQKAKAFIDVSADATQAQKYVAENERLSNKIELLKAQVAELVEGKPKTRAKRA